jgi:transketolase
MTKKNILELEKTAKEIRSLTISMIVKAHASHIASSFSIVEMLVYLYEKVLRINPKKPIDHDRDRFILSKGWGISALYAMLAVKGFFSKKLLEEYCKDGSKFIGGSTRNGIPGVEATTTSMGHGLPLGVGMALAGKLQNKSYKVYVIISDGECDEGSTWESILIAGHHKLDNLVVIIDFNKWQSFGKIKDVLNLDPLADKFHAFNWNVQEINGHDFTDLEKAFTSKSLEKNKPNIIIAHTIKGKGLSSIEDKNEWHYQTPRENEIAEAKEKGLL